MTDAAESDLAEIWAHIATAASPEIASRFLNAVEAVVEPLREFPLSGAARPHLAPGLRVVFHHPYAIYYLPTAEAVVIIRVLHGARDIATLADQGGFDA